MHFEDIRPYHDDEYQSVINKLLTKDEFFRAIKSYFPEYTDEQISTLFHTCSGIRDFQQKVVSAIVDKIISQSVTSLNYSGLEALDRDRTYLFMSNHRDIVLDSALLNYGLNKAGFNTSEIAIGSNLLSIDWVRDLARINKSFIVKRNLSNQDMLEASKTLSAYIDHALHIKKESVWIAQREGRAKDGNDKTNPGLLKMLGLGVDKPLLQHLINLHIIPVSISYEYDPCDYLKIPELTAREKGEAYLKQAGEDVKHMICGIQGKKGQVQLTFGSPIQEALKELESIRNRNEQLRQVSHIIDQQIYRNYRLWPTNYIAADLLKGKRDFEQFYTASEREEFLKYVTDRLTSFSDSHLSKKLFLEMYANPVFNQMAASS